MDAQANSVMKLNSQVEWLLGTFGNNQLLGRLAYTDSPKTGRESFSSHFYWSHRAIHGELCE